MKKTFIALIALAASAVASVYSSLDSYAERGSRWAVARWRRVVDAWDFFCFKVESGLKSVLGQFGPTGVFAMHLQRASNLVLAHVRAWRQGGTTEHYRAPGSWVSCASA